MSLLKSLTFTSAPDKELINPLIILRQKLINRLEDQRLLAKDPLYAPKQRRWKKNPDGSKVQIEQVKQIKPWWQADANGNLVLIVRNGLKTLELEKGKPAISVGSPEKLDEVLGVLIAATRAGELDEALKGAKAISKEPKADTKPISDIKKRVFG